MIARPNLTFLFLAICGVLVFAGSAQAGSKYGNPRVGGWTVESGFGDVRGGTMSLSSKRKVTKLVASPGDEQAEECGRRIELVGAPKLKSYKRFTERWALAGVSKGLFVPTRVRLKVDGKAVGGKVRLIWDSPKLASGQFRHGACILNFTLRAK